MFAQYLFSDDLVPEFRVLVGDTKTRIYIHYSVWEMYVYPRSIKESVYFSSFFLISTRRILPLIVLGSSLTNSITRGYL